MKRYNMFKNLMVASAMATMYWGWIVDGVDTFKKIVATVFIFVLMLLLLRDADRAILTEAKARRERKAKENARETA